MKSRASEKTWESALARFLRPWEKRRYVLGALVTGSRAFGVADKYSDIDVHIAMSDKVKWRERGNRRVDGFLVEYFANPLRMYPKYYREGAKAGSRSTARMFACGRILFDKDGSLGRLRKWAKRMMSQRLARPGKMFIEPAKYHMWDMEDGLLSLKERRSPGFWYAYYLALDRIIELYREFLGQETPAQDKIWEYLTNSKFRRAHRIRPFPDQHFNAMARKCMKEKSISLAFRALSCLVAHVQKRMGGFQIDGWKFRTKAK